jgi:hypothetical protein
MQVIVLQFKRLAGALVDPAGATRAAASSAEPVGLLLAVLSAVTALGAATLPRQLSALRQALSPTGQPQLDLHYQAMRDGLTRVIIADRLILSPTLLLAAVLLVLASEPILAVARDRRSAIWVMALLGLAPLLVQQVGELIVTYLAIPGAHPSPGDAINLPHRFVTGPLLFWHGDASPPPWFEVINARFNIITLWCVAVWSVGLRTLDGGKVRPWHIGAPLTCLGIAGVVTWIATPWAISALLGRP